MRNVIGLLFVAVLMSGCIAPSVAPDASILRVGISPNSRPMIFKQGNEVVGLEADFARRLGEDLERKIVFVEVPFEKQIEYLEQNKTDIIMSDMTVTPARAMRVSFVTPYMRSGLTGLFRRDTYSPGGLRTSIVLNQTKGIGCVEGTTSELFVLKEYPNFDKKVFSSVPAAVKALKKGKINMFVYDAPRILWLAAMNESELIAFPAVMNIEPLAWGVRLGNEELLTQVNALLLEWDKEGFRQKTIQKWIPESVPQ